MKLFNAAKHFLLTYYLEYKQNKSKMSINRSKYIENVIMYRKCQFKHLVNISSMSIYSYLFLS